MKKRKYISRNRSLVKGTGINALKENIRILHFVRRLPEVAALQVAVNQQMQALGTGAKASIDQKKRNSICRRAIKLIVEMSKKENG